MRIFTDMDALPVFRAPVVTVGSFDGVHRGHKHLLEIMRAKASATGGETVVVTFTDHPRRILQSKDELVLLTTLEQKALLLEAEGVDNLVVMPFDAEVSRMLPEEFIRDFLVGRLGAKELVVGYNHRFGRDGSGDAAMLGRLAEKYGFRVHEAPKFTGGSGGKGGEGGQHAGEKISSTAIRAALARGDIETAERLLGRKL